MPRPSEGRSFIQIEEYSFTPRESAGFRSALIVPLRPVMKDQTPGKAPRRVCSSSRLMWFARCRIYFLLRNEPVSQRGKSTHNDETARFSIKVWERSSPTNLDLRSGETTR